MKIRKGFVSNSSSASFILEINLTLEDCLRSLYKSYGKNKFSKGKIIPELEKELKSEKESICKYGKAIEENNKEKDINKFWLSQSGTRMKLLEETIKIINKLDDGKEMIKKYIQYRGYSVENNIFDRMEIGGFTTMWNDEEDMGTLLIDIKKHFEEKGITTRVSVFGD